MCSGAYILYFKINVPIFCYSIFPKTLNSQVKINNGKWTYCRLPPLSFRINFKDRASYFLWTSKGLISPEYCLNFFVKPVYPTMVAEKFEIRCVKITGKYIESKKWICSNILMPLCKTLPQIFIITPPGSRELCNSPKQRFFENLFFPSRIEGGLWRWKDNRVTSFDEFYHFYNPYIFGFCFVVLWFRFKHAWFKCEISLT